MGDKYLLQINIDGLIINCSFCTIFFFVKINNYLIKVTITLCRRFTQIVSFSFCDLRRDKTSIKMTSFSQNNEKNVINSYLFWEIFDIRDMKW